MQTAWGRYKVAVGAVVLLLLGAWLGRATVSASPPEPGTAGDPLVSKSYVDQVSTFRVVNVPAGQIAQGEAGTEIVVRAGKATAIASDQGGLLDATAGADIKQGQVVQTNHLLVIPRSDGRGLSAKTDLVLMVKGPLTITTPKR